MPEHLRNVLTCFEADYKMIVRRTEPWDIPPVDVTLEDVRAFARAGYLEAVHIILKKITSNIPSRVSSYYFQEVAAGTATDRPGDNKWQVIGSEQPYIVLSHNKKWENLTERQKTAFMNKRNFSWQTSSLEVNFPAMRLKVRKKYTSGTQGLFREDKIWE
jgi:hypothetical protein